MAKHAKQVVCELLTDPRMDWKQHVPDERMSVGSLCVYFQDLLPNEWPDDSKLELLIRPFLETKMGIATQYEVYYGPLNEYRDLGAKLRAYEHCRDRVRLPEVEKEWRVAFEQPSATGNRLLDRLRARFGL